MGAVMSCVAFCLSTFSVNINMMLFLYGCLGGIYCVYPVFLSDPPHPYQLNYTPPGIGFGLLYLPSIVMVGLYFDRKRAFATGIAVCGSGIGTLFFAPLAQILIDEYGWKGMTIIMGGLMLNGLVSALIYKPIKAKKISHESKNAELVCGVFCAIKKNIEGYTASPHCHHHYYYHNHHYTTYISNLLPPHHYYYLHTTTTVG